MSLGLIIGGENETLTSVKHSTTTHSLQYALNKYNRAYRDVNKMNLFAEYSVALGCLVLH